MEVKSLLTSCRTLDATGGRLGTSTVSRIIFSSVSSFIALYRVNYFSSHFFQWKHFISDTRIHYCLRHPIYYTSFLILCKYTPPCFFQVDQSFEAVITHAGQNYAQRPAGETFGN